jgi:hypothetical protein
MGYVDLDPSASLRVSAFGLKTELVFGLLVQDDNFEARCSFLKACDPLPMLG